MFHHQTGLKLHQVMSVFVQDQSVTFIVMDVSIIQLEELKQDAMFTKM